MLEGKGKWTIIVAPSPLERHLTSLPPAARRAYSINNGKGYVALYQLFDAWSCVTVRQNKGGGHTHTIQWYSITLHACGAARPCRGTRGP